MSWNELLCHYSVFLTRVCLLIFNVWTPAVLKDKVKPVLEVGVAENDACNITQK